MEKYLENLNWRYATKKFDSTKKIKGDDLEKIKEAIRLSASSYGLQPYKVLVIEDADVRERLKAASWNQTQITDASQVIVFASYTNVTEKDVDEFMQNISAVREIDLESLKGYSDTIKGTTLQLPEEQQAIWAAKQTYIGLGNLLSACATMKIDACPMEGFDAKAYNEILGLTEKGLTASVIATIGYRSDKDETQHNKKVRKSKENLFINI